MVKFFLHIFDFLRTRHRLCMALMIASIAILVAMMASLRYNENIYDFLPMSGSDKKAITLYQDISGGQRLVVTFCMTGKDSLNTDRMAEAVDTFASKVMSGQGRRHIKEITTQVDFDKYAHISDFIYQNIPLMLNDSDYSRMEQMLSKPGMADEQLAGDVQMIMMPATGFFSNNIGNDPLGLFSPVMERLQAKQQTMPVEIDNGYIFSSGRKYALAMIVSPYGAMESANNALLVSYVDSVAAATMKAMPDVRIESTGSPVIAVGNASQIKTDSQWAISIAVTLILLLLVFSFRKVRNLMLIGMAIVFGWLFAMAFIAVLRSDVSLIVLGIGSIIIGIAVNYPLHFIAHTDHGGTTREVLKEMVSPLLIGNITTVGAFASLMPLDAPALRDLGLFAAFMLIGTILFVMVFLPHLVKERVKATEEHLSFGRLSSMSFESHRWLLWVILILTLVFGYFSLNTSFDANMHHINYMTEDQQRLLDGLNVSAGLNDTSNVYVVTEGKTWDEALQKRTGLAPVLKKMYAGKMAGSYTDVTDYICSKSEQQHRITRWNDFWAKHRTEVKQMLHQYGPRYGFSSDAFDGFYSIIDGKYTSHPFEYFEPIRSVILSSSFSNSNGNCSVVDVINAKDKDKAALENTLNSIHHNGDGDTSYAFDFVGMNSSVASSLSNDFNYIGFACGFIVFIFLWLSFGRLELSLMAFLPMALGWIWILGIMDIFGMQFNIVNVILATFIFGQGDDYTIFMTDGLIEEYAYKKKILPSFKNSIIISALIMFIGMGSLIIARHPALHSLAEVTIVGMLTVVMMAWIVPPVIYGWLVKTGDRVRRVPVTIRSLTVTVLATIVYIAELVCVRLYSLTLRALPMKQTARERLLHMFWHKVMHLNISLLAHAGVKVTIRNDHNEGFSKGSVIVCRRQSLLDTVYMTALDPSVISINSKAQMSREQVSEAVSNGYNVFVLYDDAFELAHEVECDILPVYMHGTGDVLPEGSAFSSRGRVDIEIGRRISAEQLRDDASEGSEMARSFTKMYTDHYADMRQRIEDTHYFHHYLIGRYLYKGIGIEKETRRLLRRYDDFSQWIDGYTPQSADTGEVSILNAGKGQFAMLMALVHPRLKVDAFTSDPDDFALASCCEPMPQNLHFHHAESGDSHSSINTIDLAELLTDK